MSQLISLLELAVIIGIVLLVRRHLNRGTGPQISSLEQMDVADAAVGAHFRAVAPDEVFLLAVPARLARRTGWLVASSRRVWWICNSGRSYAQEAEYEYDLQTNITGGSPFTLPVLSIGTALFRTSRENAEAMSRVIRQRRDLAVDRPAAAGDAEISSAKVGVADELAKFAAMRDSGVLTDDEFQKKKRELLG